MVYIVEHLGGLLALSIGLGSVAHGPLLGMFTLGMLFPRASSKVNIFYLPDKRKLYYIILGCILGCDYLCSLHVSDNFWRKILRTNGNDSPSWLASLC